jgi:hypothetical protein
MPSFLEQEQAEIRPIGMSMRPSSCAVKVIQAARTRMTRVLAKPLPLSHSLMPVHALYLMRVAGIDHCILEALRTRPASAKAMWESPALSLFVELLCNHVASDLPLGGPFDKSYSERKRTCTHFCTPLVNA